MNALYIHVPWCRRRCPYCDFYLVVGQPEPSFVDAIKCEFLHRREKWPEPASSLYFGGGTPSLLSPAQIQELIMFFKEQNYLSSNSEITIEVNPEDINLNYISKLSETLVNRLSIGVQSFDDNILRFLGRMHTSDQAKKALDLCQSYFKNISVDLIIGIAGENKNYIKKDLNYLADININHISCYLLTIEENTNFYRRIKKNLMSEAPEEGQIASYNLVQQELITLDYEQYDISSYARPGSRSKHNQLYWSMGSYLGLGPGAHSLRLLADGSKERSSNQKALKTWLSHPTNTDHTVYDLLTPSHALLESLAFGLRNMQEGINIDELCALHQSPAPKKLSDLLKNICKSGHLEKIGERFRVSSKGALFIDGIMREILTIRL